MTTTTEQPKYRTITLTNRPPVRLDEDQWTVLAAGVWKDFDNQYEFQANRTWKAEIRVRQHADGRAVVYGVYDYDTRFQGEKCETHKVGALLAADDTDYVRAIKRVAEELIERLHDAGMARHIRDAANECIADLPAETL